MSAAVARMCVARRMKEDPQEKAAIGQQPFALDDNSASSAEARAPARPPRGLI
jgi:hypothetical protein